MEDHKHYINFKFKELNKDFASQCLEVEKTCMQMQGEVGDMKVQVKSIKDYTQGIDVRFYILETSLSELKEDFQAQQFFYSFNEKINNLDSRVKAHLNQL